MYSARDILIQSGARPPAPTAAAADAEAADDGGGGASAAAADARQTNSKEFKEVLENLENYEMRFMAFDVLYDTDHSVIDRPLFERHSILRSVVRPLHEDGPDEAPGTRLTPEGAAKRVDGRLSLVLPGSVWSHPLPHGPAARPEIERLLTAAMERDEEGLLIKRVDSEWRKGDRTNAWMKMKPDYLPTEDLDILIIGGYMGTGAKRGGYISEYLLALAEQPRGGDGLEPSTFISFCKVGSGFTNDQLIQLRDRLKPVLVPGGRGNAPPGCYKVTGHRDETPDVWVSDPRRSVVLSVKADVRLCATDTFKTAHSLRFPRATAVGWDKSWRDIFSDADLQRLVAETGNKLKVMAPSDARFSWKPSGSGGRRGKGGQSKPPPPSLAAGVRAHAPGRAPAQRLAPGVAPTSTVLSGEKILILNFPPGITPVSVQSRIAQHGGAVHMALNAETTRIIAATYNPHLAGQKEAAASGRDILAFSWLDDSIALGGVIDPPAPRHLLRYIPGRGGAGGSAGGCGSGGGAEFGATDRYGDPFESDVTAEDVAALLRRVEGTLRERAAGDAREAAARKKLGKAADDPSMLYAQRFEGEDISKAAERGAKAERAAAKAGDEAAAAVRAAPPPPLPPTDVAALLEEERGLDGCQYAAMRHVACVLLPLPPPRTVGASRGGGGGATPCAMDVDEPGWFHFLADTAGAAAAAAADALARPLEVARLRSRIALHGGTTLDAAAADAVTRATHVVAMLHGGWAATGAEERAEHPEQPPCVEEAFDALAAMGERGALLAERVRRGGCHLVSLGWLRARLSAAAAAAAGGASDGDGGRAAADDAPTSELAFALRVEAEEAEREAAAADDDAERGGAATGDDGDGGEGGGKRQRQA